MPTLIVRYPAVSGKKDAPKYKKIKGVEYRMVEEEKVMKAIKLPPQTKEQIEALEEFYHRTKEIRLRTRVQMVLLAAEQNLKANEIGKIVRESDNTVRRWLRRYKAEGIDGLYDMPRPGAPLKVTAEYIEQLVNTVRRRPRSLGQPYSLWTLQRLADYMAEETGIRITRQALRVVLAENTHPCD